jgi:hypothetical protein
MKRKIATLFKDLCCSRCKASFDEKSVQIMREESAMLVFKLTCEECGKTFGVAFLGISDFDLKDYDAETEHDDLVLKVQDGPAPIDADDVLDAHKFIQDLEDGWKKFIDDSRE